MRNASAVHRFASQTKSCVLVSRPCKLVASILTTSCVSAHPRRTLTIPSPLAAFAGVSVQPHVN